MENTLYIGSFRKCLPEKGQVTVIIERAYSSRVRSTFPSLARVWAVLSTEPFTERMSKVEE